MPVAESPVPEKPTVGEATRWAAGLLGRAGCDSPLLDAELLLCHVLSVGRGALLARSQEALPAEALDAFCGLVQRRVDRVPLAWLTGERAFYDVSLAVGPSVLVPRPETELLVEEVLAWCQSVPAGALRIADVGTGSGAIAVTLAMHLPQAMVVATDVSAAALAVASGNVRRYGVNRRVSLVRTDLLSGLAGPFDVIAANLPYVPSSRFAELAPEVRDHEPRLALDGGPEGLDVIARLLPQAAERLRSTALVALEVDEIQADAVGAMARAFWPQATVRCVKDLAGLDRLICVTVGNAAQPSAQARGRRGS